MSIKISSTTKKSAPAKETDFFAFLNKDLSFSGNKISDKKKEELYHELSILFSAGVDIRTAFDLIESEQTKKKDKELIQTIKTAIVSGHSLSSAIKQTGLFTPYEYFSIQIGEESGKLGSVLNELARFYQNKIKQSRQLVSALSYPALVLFTSVGAIFFMMNYIVPMFGDIFKRFGGDLPFITKMVISFSEFMNAYFYLFVLIIVGTTGFLISQKNKEWLRKLVSVIILKTPIMGEIIRKIYLARFCNSMALLIGSRIPLVKSIGLVRRMIGFYPIEQSLITIETDILRGESFHKSLSAFPIFNQRMISLVKVGEEVNKLESFFDKIGKQYTEEVEYQTSIIASLIEPLMIIFLGLVVGVILISMYLPLFQLGNSLN